MGGASPATVTFRGVIVDPTTGDALTELARIAGDDIYVSPIPGFGSYRQNAASGGTDTGGGHCDINAERLTDEQARRLETRARSLGFVAYFRPRVSPYSGRSYGWQRHVHLLRRDCTDLSPAARAQVGEYDAGWDGLAVRHKDTGSRAYVGVTWASYLAAQKPAPAPVAPPKEPDMQFSDVIPGTNPPVTVGQALARGLHAYGQVVNGGWLQGVTVTTRDQVNRQATALGALAADVADLPDTVKTLLQDAAVTVDVNFKQPEPPA